MTAKIYTRTGDQGETGLVWGPRVGKDMARIETIGAIDELNAVLGLARSENLPAEIDGPLERIQNELFCFGAEVATPRAAEHGMQQIQRRHVESLEADIDRISERLAPLSQLGRRAGPARRPRCTWPEPSAAGRNGGWWRWCASVRRTCPCCCWRI